MVKTDYTRVELIAICQRAIVQQENWDNRDSAGAQRQVGEAWALLRAGCAFEICHTAGDTCVTDEETVWIEITFNGFGSFEGGDADTETYYLPTPARLSRQKWGEDWY